jgi:Flp pilus assembly protein TadD
MRRTTAIASLLAALGCAGAPPRPAPPAAAPPEPTAEAKPPAPAAAKVAPKTVPPERADGPKDGVPPRAQRLFQEAVRAEEEQRKQSGAPDFAYLERKWRAVVDAADLAEAHHNLGVALEGQGKLGEARAEYERARELKPGLRQAAVNLGVVLEKQGDTRGAAAVYAQCVRDFPEDAVARERLALLYAASGQLDEAWRVAREALVREPRALGAYKALARVALQRNELDLAKLVALRAEKLDAQDPELPFVVGRVLARQGDEPGAEVQFRRALALAGSYLPARYALLDLALRKQAWGAVAEHSGAILAAEPQNAPVHLVRGLALRHTGKPEEALAAYARAEEASGGRLAEVHLARGVLYARVKSECEPALAELKTYQTRAGPVLPDGARQVVKLQRECEAQLEENRRAAEAAKQLQAEAARQAAEKGAPSVNGGAAASPSEERAPAPTRAHPAR